ncbi:MAG: lysophospholipid acyltransferase family protein [Anaerolineae bacterium]|nr:1-acyl-sn-glycerol-3-phosphate acyltransferase [Thermoflexales bacterium]MDW8408013.1 lysophospholipid acyltransferase family protein [Anaerolineae bacterium]
MRSRTAGKKSIFTRRWKWNKHAPLRGFYNFWLKLFYRLLLRHTVIGLEHVPKTGPAIVMINHVAWADPFVVLAALGRPIVPMAKVEVFEDWRVRWLTAPYGAIPVHRGDVDTQAIRSATDVLNEGGLVLISPEGTRSPTGGLIQAQEGMAYLAVRSGAPILPVAITGTQTINTEWKRLRRPRVTITIGRPFRLEAGSDKLSREGLRRLTDDAMRRLAALLPEDMRGVYR